MTLHDDAMRTIIELPEEQITGLAALCERQGISRAEAIRQAVGQLLKSAKEESTAYRDAFGLWRHKGRDGRTYVEQLRAEWR
jgi:hypothetical protein